MLARVEDWDAAYANAPAIPGGDTWPERWVAEAAAFRDTLGARAEIGIAYGDHARERYDLFRPEGAARGLAVFVHGGYWLRFDPSFFSYLAAGPLARSWAVAMPGYTLAPEARVGAMVRQVGRAVAHAAARIEGPIRLAGHSAGGHLATRLACADAPALVGAGVAERIRRVVSISGVHDLRPLTRTALNSTIRLDAEEARAQSPALLEPREGTELVAWVGQAERAEFVRQSELLANVWRGLGAATRVHAAPDRHHFDVIDALADPSSDLTRALFDD